MLSLLTFNAPVLHGVSIAEIPFVMDKCWLFVGALPY